MALTSALNSIIFPPALALTLALAGTQNTPVEIEESKNMEFVIEAKELNREEILKEFFEKYDSPLKEHASTFVEVADEYEIDYTLLPAISCMESTCGKFMPYESNNAFGWGVYGGSYIKFESHDDAIYAVGEGLNENYFSKGLDTIDEIAPVYTPPNSHHWKNGVKFFTKQIDEIALKSTS